MQRHAEVVCSEVQRCAEVGCRGSMQRWGAEVVCRGGMQRELAEVAWRGGMERWHGEMVCGGDTPALSLANEILIFAVSCTHLPAMDQQWLT